MQENIYGTIRLRYKGEALKRYQAKPTIFEKTFLKNIDGLFNPKNEFEIFFGKGCELFNNNKELKKIYKEFKKSLSLNIIIITYNKDRIIRIGVNDGSEYSKAFSNDYTCFYFKLDEKFINKNGSHNQELIKKTFFDDLVVELLKVKIEKKKLTD